MVIYFLQRCARRWLTMKSLCPKLAEHHAAKTIQAVFRCWTMKTYFTSAQLGVTIIQSAWRSFSQKRQYEVSIRSAIKIQKIARGFLATNEKVRRIEAITKIQCTARRYVATCTAIALQIEVNYRAQVNEVAIFCQVCLFVSHILLCLSICFFSNLFSHLYNFTAQIL